MNYVPSARCLICDSNINLHKFPKDEGKFCQWLCAINRKDVIKDPNFFKLVKDKGRICKDHFEDWCFTSSERRKLVKFAKPMQKGPFDDEDLGEDCQPELIEVMDDTTQDEFVLPKLKEPVVFKNKLRGKSWNRMPWRQEELLEKYGKINLSFRIVPKVHEGIAWESSSKHVKASVDQFFEWLLNKPNKNNPFGAFDPQEFSAYSSYNHMSQIFGEDDDIVQAVDWSKFGYHEKPGQNSAFWIGSRGSYTPCHYDTYGCNLVAQIIGKKKWILFPPEDTPYMYPTRIPYEESSVHSSVNILDPDFEKHPLFKFAHPHIVVLQPGDVLFVPHKWWHFVQNLVPAMSINTWIKLDVDNETHLEEAVARTMMTGLISYFEPEGISWINTHEELFSPEETLKFITLSLGKIKEFLSSSQEPNLENHNNENNLEGCNNQADSESHSNQDNSEACSNEANSEGHISKANSEGHISKANSEGHISKANSEGHISKANPGSQSNKADTENHCNESSSETSRKIAKISPESDVHSENSKEALRILQMRHTVNFVNPTPFSEWLGKDPKIIASCSEQTLSKKKIMDCFSNPNVISLICTNLRNA